MNLDALEDNLVFTIPNGYRTFVSRGYCDLSALDTTYLWVNEAEWIPLEAIPSRNMWRDNPLPGLVPFAFTGGGDNWCWNTNQPTSKSEYEILMCYRDDDFAARYAPDFPSWFYRTCLDFASCVDIDAGEIEDARKHLQLWSLRLAEIGPSDWADHLGALAKSTPSSFIRCFNEREYAEFGFLTHDDIANIVRERFGPSYLDRTVEWGS
ncbi:SMI1/KNR4 family protein [Rosistilla oblonga]|uniref:SMI1/KNR4 family protein n=1 Tax=Rosistilla oblonga TaxID=2527990 RepID=UPI003A9866EE